MGACRCTRCPTWSGLGGGPGSEAWSLTSPHAARGAGAALVRAAETQARRWGCLAIEVTSARTRHDAQAFYQRMGFTDVCDRSGRFLKELG